MLDKFLKSRIPDAKKLVEDLGKSFDYVSILGTCVNTKRISVSTRINSLDEVDNECGFVIKVYRDGRYSEYSCNDIRGLKAASIRNAVKLDEVIKYRIYKIRGGRTLARTGLSDAFISSCHQLSPPLR